MRWLTRGKPNNDFYRGDAEAQSFLVFGAAGAVNNNKLFSVSLRLRGEISFIKHNACTLCQYQTITIIKAKYH